jgi:Family of unknown function (DUF6194)
VEPTVHEASIITYIRETYPDADILTAGSGTFFSCDPDKHWPNFATLVTSDEYDSASKLDRPGVYRLNIGVSKATFDSLVGSASHPDYTVLDQVVPHPVYALQHWVSVLNPTAATFDSVVKPLLDEAHERVARSRRKKTFASTES